MITRIVLKNFQAHRHLDIEAGNLTTLTGGSNSGKSSVLRAVAGLLRNDSVGDYVTHGEKTLSVKLYFSDGHAVEWVKGAGENSYYITLPSGDIQEYSKVGSDVPAEVSTVLGLTPVVLESGEKVHLNLHPQLDSPFLVADTPGFVAKVFGELTSVSKLYAAVAEGNKVSRAKNTLRRTRKEDLRGLTEKLQDFPDHDYYEELWNEAYEAWKQADSTAAKIEDIVALSGRIAEAQAGEQKLESVIEGLRPATEVDFEPISGLAERIASLRGSTEKLEELTEALTKIDLLEEKYVGAKKLDLDRVGTVHEEIRNLSGYAQGIEQLEDEQITLSTAIANHSASSERLQGLIDDLLETLTSCPSCLQDLDENAKAALIEGETHVAC